MGRSDRLDSPPAVATPCGERLLAPVACDQRGKRSGMRNSAVSSKRRFLIIFALLSAVALSAALAFAVARNDDAPSTEPSSASPKASQYRPPTSTVSADAALHGRIEADELTRFAAAAPTVVKAESEGFPAKNSPPADALPGVRRPCESARGFTIFVTKELAGLPLKQVYSTCETPPGVEGGRLLRPVRTNDTVAQYGRCTSAAAPPCPVRQLAVTSAPSCEKPHAIYHALAGPGRQFVEPHTHFRLRGVPAIRFDNATAITLYTKWTTVTIRSNDRRLTMKAAQAVMPSPHAFRAEDASADRLPEPSSAISSNRLTKVQCPE